MLNKRGQTIFLTSGKWLTWAQVQREKLRMKQLKIYAIRDDLN